MTPLAGQRKVRVNLGEQFDEVGLAENNKWIEMVVEGLDVYLVSLLFCYFCSSSGTFFSPTTMEHCILWIALLPHNLRSTTRGLSRS